MGLRIWRPYKLTLVDNHRSLLIVALVFPGLTTAPQLLPAFWSISWTGFSLCRTPLHGWSSKLVVRTTFSRYCVDYTVPAGSASVSLPPRLCTWLFGSDLQSVSHLNARRRLRSSTTLALVALTLTVTYSIF